jgi:MerR family transcriptional regulator, thiopeptide resistance regulator
MRYTVKQLADLAGISTRTLHYYDEIGLLEPSSVGDNGYRYYGEEAAVRLQQILFYRELDVSLSEIRTILDRPEFNVLLALEAHRRALQERVARLNGLMETVDKTMAHMRGERGMSTDELFEGFDEETQKGYEEEASRLWGEKHVKESRRRWDSYSKEKRAAILAEGGEIYRGLMTHLGDDPASKPVQQGIARWHQNLRYFYEPTTEILRGLGQAYSQHPQFRATFTKMHPDLPEFLTAAIEHYCQAVGGPG